MEEKIKKIENLKELLRKIEKDKNIFFYKKFLKNKGFSHENFEFPNDIKKIPTISFDDLASSKFRERTYSFDLKREKTVKVISRNNSCFLIERGLSDIKRENFGTACRSPFILMKNSYEALEKTIWFYENGILPTIGETIISEIALMAIKEFESDLILTDEETLNSYLKILKENIDLSKISMTILGQKFKNKELIELNKEVKNLRFLLSLPETGAFAESCPEALKKGRLLFHPDKNSILEYQDKLIVTKVIEMPTPIIRYQTEIPVKSVEKNCSCQEKECFLLA
jgi:hypothetical protein